jgi:phospholipase C
MTQFEPRQIPNLARLARRFVISDRTFETDIAGSWASHLEIVAARLAGFTGDNPEPREDDGPGWGCDSRKKAPWRAKPGAAVKHVPSCIPDSDLNPTRYPYGGAYRPTPVEQIPTIMDRLDQAGLTWKLYAATKETGNGYLWSICPTFADCLYTPSRSNLVPRHQVLGDAKHGRLPAFSAVLPSPKLSQHNTFSMAQGDNWIGQVVRAIEKGPDWGSTAIFITYDDCGCFYDHVAPPPGFGPRLPMVIVSPYAKPHHTDHGTASQASILAFTERTFGLPSLGAKDAAAYDYSHSFDYGQTPLAPVPVTHTNISRAERQRLKTIPHIAMGT